MLNDEKVKLMTQLAIFEQRNGKKYMTMTKYYRKDYVGYQMIKTFLYSTLAFGILFLLWILYKMDYLMENIHKFDIIDQGIALLLRYIAFTITYQIIACVVYNIKYEAGKKEIKNYQTKLKKVIKFYKKENRGEQ